MSVVGKYRYFMHSPAEHVSVPVIVDIILVGRTKIITLHSSIWLDNRTDRRVAFRLHVPITPLVAPVAEAPGCPPSDFKTDAPIGPLSPGEGAHSPSPWLLVTLKLSSSQTRRATASQLVSCSSVAGAGMQKAREDSMPPGEICYCVHASLSAVHLYGASY